MAITVEFKEICSTCGGTGQQPVQEGEVLIDCFMCEGTGKRMIGTAEIDVPSTAQFNNKFQQIETALQAIWNKVKDL